MGQNAPVKLVQTFTYHIAETFVILTSHAAISTLFRASIGTRSAQTCCPRHANWKDMPMGLTEVELVGMNEASETIVDKLAIHDKPGAMDKLTAH